MVDVTATESAALERVAAHFDGLVAKFGEDHRALDYGSRSSQTLRFDVLAHGLPLAGRRVLDVGCGMADLAGYLHEREIEAEYAGVDISREMIAAAKRKYPGVNVRVGNILSDSEPVTCDVAIANGIFYLLGEEAEAIMYATVARMFELAEEAIAFTSLSTWAADRVDGEYHADPSVVLAYCRSLTPYVTLRHDYLAHDFAVFLYKRAQGA
ncbi:MAG: class I SAM-dependent methyltransferase [Phycisphaerales bacterium]|nr:class I SAM-dependent methyltransferase [Phycisphaerales bacterium]